MTKSFLIPLLFFIVPFPAVSRSANPQFRAVAFYSTNVEGDHVLFAEDGLKFFAALAQKDNFVFDSTTDWHNLNEDYLKNYQLVVWLNDSPADPAERRAFEKYMKSGGAWLGFHYSGYNDKDTAWPWFVDFLGGSVFYTNSWPPLPAKLLIDDPAHPVVASLPDSYLAPQNEWYIWQPSPRLNKEVRVLLTLDPANYPLGFKDILTAGDLPVVWSNTKYKMVYANMGHGDKIFTTSTQNKLFENALLWLVSKTPTPMRAGTKRESAPPAAGVRVSPNAVAVNPKTHKAYGVDLASGSVTVVDPGSGRASSVKVGETPLAISINPETNRIYVANSASGTVSVIDGSLDAVTATVNVGSLPTVMVTNPATNKVYITHTFNNTMTVLDGASNSTSTLGFNADAMAVNPSTNRLYLLNYENGSTSQIQVLDGSNLSLSKIPTAGHLWGMVLNPATGKVYVGNTGASTLTVVDGTQGKATAAAVSQIPCAIAIDANASRVYVSNYAGSSVSVLDASTDTVLATIDVAPYPQAIAVNPATHMVFAVSTRGDTVTIINGAINKVIANIPVPKGPYAIAVDDFDNRIFVETIAGHQLMLIDGKTFRVTPVVP
jgi:YVTN family beta-propeller protein